MLLYKWNKKVVKSGGTVCSKWQYSNHLEKQQMVFKKTVYTYN